MKINYAVMGSTKDPIYYDFWPLVSRIWKERFDVTPVLGLIGEKFNTSRDEYGIIMEFPKITGYDDGLLSQLIRIYLPKLLEDICIISDIDMIPISKKYFIEDLKNYEDNQFLILSSHHPQTAGLNQYPMCYVVGSSDNFIKIFDLSTDWESFVRGITLSGWYTDQVFLYEKINSNNEVNFSFPVRENGFYSNRIDRFEWGYNTELLDKDFYIDCHSLRPYLDYKIEIDKLIKYILK